MILNKYLLLEKDDVKHVFHWSDNTSMSAVAKQICCSKNDTKEFLRINGIRVPRGTNYYRKSVDKMIEYAKSLGDRVVLKPDNGDFGHHVYCNIKPEDIKQILDKIPTKYDMFNVEEFIKGKDYRVLATKKGFIAVCQRRAANVIGDGKSTIKELITETNKYRHKKYSEPRIYPREQIQIDDHLLLFLEKNNKTLDTIPEKDECVYLRSNSNVSSGGESIDLTDKAHPSVKKIAMQVLESIPGLSYAGIDFMTPDITKDITNNYAIIEVNNMPGLSVHHYPDVGKPRNAAGALIDLVFPKE
jgi:cyanophycin synthetase